MLGGIFNRICRGEGAFSNFEIFRKALNTVYTTLNRVISGRTYVDLFSTQFVSTPIIVNETLSVDKDTPLLDDNQIPNFPLPVNIQSIDTTNDYLILPSTHQFYLSCPVIYRNTTGTIASLTDKEVYYIRTISGSSITLSSQIGGTITDISGAYTGTGSIELADPLPQVNETSLLRVDLNIPGPTIGNLAHGDYLNGTSSLYVYGSNGYEFVKLGWNGGAGFYNNQATFSQTYTGWCHGMGNVKILSYSGEDIDISFDFIEVVEPGSGIRDIVPGVRTNPTSDYNIRIVNGDAGLNSIDEGVIFGTTGYWVWLAYNANTGGYGGLLSLSNSNPITPEGYDFVQRLGWIRTASGGLFFPSLQINKEFLFGERPSAAVTITTSSTVAQTSALVVITNNSSVLYPSPTLLSDVTVTGRITAAATNGTVAYRKQFWVSSAMAGSSTSAFQKGESWSVFTSNDADYLFNNIPVNNTVFDSSDLVFNVQNGATVAVSYDATIMGFDFNGDLYL